VPGAALTVVTGMNDKGEITGYFAQNVGDTYHGFLREPDGTTTTFDPSGQGILPSLETESLGINDNGEIAGFFIDATPASHGFVRKADGTFLQLDAPNHKFSTATMIGQDGKIIGTADAQGFRLNRKAWKGE
jgi:hypothetical protein